MRYHVTITTSPIDFPAYFTPEEITAQVRSLLRDLARRHLTTDVETVEIIVITTPAEPITTLPTVDNTATLVKNQAAEPETVAAPAGWSTISGVTEA